SLTSIGGEVHVVDAPAVRDAHAGLLAPGRRVVEVQPFVELRDHDRRLPVRREVEVVDVLYGDEGARLAGGRVDRRDPAGRYLVGADVDGAHVVAGHDVLGLRTSGKRGDDFEGLRVDDGDVVGDGVGHVHQLTVALHRIRQHVRPGF